MIRYVTHLTNLITERVDGIGKELDGINRLRESMSLVLREGAQVDANINEAVEKMAAVLKKCAGQE